MLAAPRSRLLLNTVEAAVQWKMMEWEFHPPSLARKEVSARCTVCFSRVCLVHISYQLDTSKLDNSSAVYGGNGTFLAHLSALSLLSITSRHYLHRSHNSISMHKSEVVSRQTPAPLQQHLYPNQHGTRVNVKDLFGSMPVRVKQRAVDAGKQQLRTKVWDQLRREVVALLLSWPTAVGLTLREAESNQRLVIRKGYANPIASHVDQAEVQSNCSILAQAGYMDLLEKQLWIPIKGSTIKLEVTGAISLMPNATKNVQFIAFGIEPMMQDSQNMLYHVINDLFSKSAFGNDDVVGNLTKAKTRPRANGQAYAGDGHTQKELKGARKGVDRWPMFHINIHQTENSPSSERLNIDEVLNCKGTTLAAVTDLLEAMILEFLTKNHFRPNLGRGHRSNRQETNTLDANHEDKRQSAIKTDHLAADERSNGASTSAHTERTRSALQLDMLGTNVKLPCFRRAMMHAEDDFADRTKIRSSAKVYKPQQQHSSNSNTNLSATSSTPHGGKSSLSSGFSLTIPTTPLIDKSGNLLRRPFDNLPGHVSRPLRFQPSSLLSEPTLGSPKKETVQLRRLKSDSTSSNSTLGAGLTDEGDKQVEWINPITKVRSMVNQRTGHVIAVDMNGAKLHNSPSLRLPPRNLISGSMIDRSASEPSPWLRKLLSNWDNPTFAPAEACVPQVSLDGIELGARSILHGRHHNCSQHDIDRAFKESSSGLNSRLSKDALRSAEIVAQVDKKFILAKLRTVSSLEPTLLVMIDQHAADERIRIEKLMAELCSKCPTPLSPFFFFLSPSNRCLLCWRWTTAKAR